MRSERDEPRTSPAIPRRAYGLIVMGVVVLLGILPGAGYLHWRAPEVREQIERNLAKAPKDPMGRLDVWLTTGEPNIQSRLSQLRLSGRQPWLVTHAVRGEGPQEVWGLDLTSKRPARFVREGLRVELHFPEPSLLGYGELTGDNADRVPVFASRALVPDPAQRAGELLRWFLGGIPDALAGDIPGAELVVLVDDPPANPAVELAEQ